MTTRAVLSGVLLWAALCVVLGIEVATASAATGQGIWWELAGGLVLTAVAVALRRPYPTASLLAAAATGLFLATAGTRLPLWPFVPMAVTALLAGRRMARERGVLAGLGALAAIGLGLAEVTGRGMSGWFRLVFALLFAVVFPWLVGRYWRQRTEIAVLGWERAEQLERERRMVSDQARLRERARIAQDMHDSLGHDLTLLAVRAGALEVDRSLPVRHHAAVRELRAAASTATGRLRDIIGVLRDESDPAPVQPREEAVAGLVERARDSGMDIRLESVGDGTEPPPMVDRAAYRVVQESLTNAAKHAPGRPVTVQLACTGTETTVAVRNQLATGGTAGQMGGGRGLAGLRERVRLAGGTFDAALADGWFEVRVRLPYDGAPPVTDEVEPVTSESATQLASARDRARRGLVVAVTVPAVVGAVLAVGLLGLSMFRAATSALPPAAYARIQVGQPHSEIAPLLPPRRAAPAGRDPAKPAGARCEYYRVDGNYFADLDEYRLCFRAGRLVAKDFIPDDPNS